MSMKIRVVPRSLATLKQLSNPNGASNESIPWVFYDTQSYAQAGAQSLVFFQSPSGDKTISNMETGGQFSDPQYFEVQYMGLDFLLAGPSNVTRRKSASGSNPSPADGSA